MNKILWTNSTNSGLGDRLIDIFLMSAYAKSLNSELYFDWRTFDGIHEWELNNSERKVWEEIRYVDYLYENFSNYFTLPSNVHINEDSVDCSVYVEFYLGGVYSPHSFHRKFLIDNISIEDFLRHFYDSLDEFRPTIKLLDIVGDKVKVDIAVHLRRQDKVRLDSCPVTLREDQISDLNIKTMDILNSLLSESNNILYISSDDESEKEIYKNKYNGCSVDNFKISEIYEKTYVDIYMMSMCDTIILSQKHSSFSLFASLLKRSKFIYFYEECQINIMEFNKLDNMIFYKNYKFT